MGKCLKSRCYVSNCKIAYSFILSRIHISRFFRYVAEEKRPDRTEIHNTWTMIELSVNATLTHTKLLKFLICFGLNKHKFFISRNSPNQSILKFLDIKLFPSKYSHFRIANTITKCISRKITFHCLLSKLSPEKRCKVNKRKLFF